MSLETREIEKDVVPILQEVVGPITGDEDADVRVIIAEQDKPRPQERSYVTIRVTNFQQLGREQVTPQAGGLTRIQADYRIELRVRAIGGRAKDVLSCILFAFNRDDIIDRFACDAKLAFSEHSESIHVPTLINEVFEERSQATIVFFHSVVQEVDLGCIEKVDTLDGNYLNQGGDIVLTTSTTVP